MDVVGVGPPKRDQVLYALLLSVLHMVLELAPLVARDGWVDQVIPFAPERYAMLGQQRV
jgi:hypothetical protein